MKRFLPWLYALFLLALCACGPAPKEDEPEEPLQLKSLCVEVSRGDLTDQDLARAVQELPEALREALADQGVEAETVTVSVGSSPAATAQAVREGGVDVAFLSREDCDALEPVPQPLLAAAPESGSSGAMAAITRPDDETLSGEAFAAALAAAVNGLRKEQPVFGPYDYAWVPPDGEG